MSPDFSRLSPEKRAQAEAAHARMMAAFTYERVATTGAQALSEWERLKVAGRGWPLVAGGDEDLERLAEQFSLSDPAEIISTAGKLQFQDDLAQWSTEEELCAPLGDWPPKDLVPDGTGLSVAIDIRTGKPLERVHIVLVPARESWEAPAYLRWGGWNACPPPEHHVAALHSWSERYGAELVGVTGDVLNLRVKRRPSSREEAIALAWEQYRYCPDLVEQGVETVSALAAMLMAEDWWYFWWD